MKYLIVDDEPLAVLRLQKMLEHTGITDIITAKNGAVAVELVKKHHPHVVFMDIQMPVLTGIEAAKQINEISPESQIIFCTAYDDFAIDAFDLSAADYLLKPVSTERLAQAIAKVDASENIRDTISFYRGKDLLSISIDEVYCFISEDKNTYMYYEDGTVIIDESLVMLESYFKKHLLRVNRNALVNKVELSGIHRDKSQAYAILKHCQYQPQISRRNLSQVKDIIKHEH